MASGLLLLPWSCWWTEASEDPALSLNPLQEQKCGVSSFASYTCNPEPPRTSALRTESKSSFKRETDETCPQKYKELNSARTSRASLPRRTTYSNVKLRGHVRFLHAFFLHHIPFHTPRHHCGTVSCCPGYVASEAAALQCTMQHGIRCFLPSDSHQPITFTSSFYPERRWV